MKKILNLAAIVLLSAGVAQAQRATEYDLHSSSQDIRSYNRIGVSYNNTHYGGNNDYNRYITDQDMDLSLNGVGLEYIRGFRLSSSIPMFLEIGVNINFNFGTEEGLESGYREYKNKYKDINFQVPVNFLYRFRITDEFSIAPYLGLNLKAHAVTRKTTEYPYKDSRCSVNLYSKDNMGEENTWNRFQIGWHLGTYLQYSKVYLGIQYGTDFIPAYSHHESKINTGTFKLSVGYTF